MSTVTFMRPKQHWYCRTIGAVKLWAPSAKGWSYSSRRRFRIRCGGTEGVVPS